MAVIPCYVRELMDVKVCEAAVSSLRATAGDRCEVMLIDDGSPDAELVGALADIAELNGARFFAKDENEGYARTINVGLRRCLVEGRDAITINSDIEFGLTSDWLGLMQRQMRSDGQGLASVVGALLLYPNGLIQHGGVFFSVLTRDFGHRFNYGPGNLPEAQIATVCPVTGALQFIRHECLQTVGLYDETFRMGWEDVDYCVRVWLSGRQCIYQPGVRAIHHESFFRGQTRADKKIAQWTHDSWHRFVEKYAHQSFAEFVPNMMALDG